MELSLLMKVVGVGIVIAAANQILNRAGKDDIAIWVSVAGIVLILAMLMTNVKTLFDNIKSVFGL